MPIIAQIDRQGGEARLASSERQRSLRLGERGLLLGHPASPDRRPLSELGDADIAELVGEGRRRPTLKGTWTHLSVAGGELTVNTDDFNTRPLFIRADATGVAVSDDVWSLLDRDHELDPAGIADFLFAGVHQGDRTSFARITTTRAATRWHWSDGDARWEMDSPDVLRYAEAEALESLDPAMDALLTPYRDHPRLLIQLSGGLDSRVLAALALEAGFEVHAWTFVTRPRTEEEEIAREVAAELGVRHTISTGAPASDEGLRKFVEATSGQVSASDGHSYSWMPPPPEEWPIAVNGIMGDVLLGGSFLLPAATPPGQVVAEKTRRLLGGSEPSRLQRYLPGVPAWSGEIERHMESLYEKVDRNPRLADWMVLLNRPGRFNVYGSIALSAHHDYIAPFLDDDLGAVTYSLPDSQQRDSKAYLRWIADRWPGLARIRWEKTGVPLDQSLGGLARRWRYVRKRYSIGRPISFTEHKLWYERNLPIIQPRVERASRTLAGHGIDVPALLTDFPDRTPRGRAFRGRLAAIDAAIERAQGGAA